jgi:LPS-assembly protein
LSSLALAAALGLACGPILGTSAFAAPSAAKSSSKAPANSLAAPKVAAQKPVDDKRMVVEARELIQDDNKNTVTARGGVQIYYKGRILEADEVVYDRKSSRVSAHGRARLTEEDGRVTYADKFELTEDFKQGFVDSVRVITTDQTYMSAARAERDDDTTVFDRGTYTACKPCEDATRPPLWRVRAKRIIHDSTDKTLYYQDASLEFLGVPLAYVPFISAPDPSVKRRSGILAPSYIYSPQLGYGAGVPIYWAVAPNMDLTVTPKVTTKQGFMGTAEWAHRTENGAYSIRADGVWQSNRTLFAQAPYGGGDKKFRGSVTSSGNFAINSMWKWGWDATAVSDRYFFQDFRLTNNLLQDIYFRESSSTAYLTGKGARSYFDLRGYYFQGLSARDFNPQLPRVGPLLDYNRRWGIDPARTGGLGGEIELDANFTRVSAQAALYESQLPRTFDRWNSLYNVCQTYAPSAIPMASQCLLRGVGGDYTRGTAQASWKRTFIDPIGQMWTPFAFARGSVNYLNYDQSRVYGLYNTGYWPMMNAMQSNFYGSDNVWRGQINPGVGLEYRFPLMSRFNFGTLIFEPIAQIIARPNTFGSNSMVNIDAQSLIFDDSNLFSWNKFSGYDRFETGTRLNYGGQATLNFNNGGFINVAAGQSLQLAGRNGYATPDAANVGLSSGLDTRRSDYVGRFAFAPNSILSFVAKGRFDPATMRPRRIDLIAGVTLGGLTATAQYANYMAQPSIGFDKRRQGLAIGARYDITDHYFINGNVQFDLSRHLYNYQLNSLGTSFGAAPVFSVQGLGIGAGYKDECTTFTVSYTSLYQINSTTGLPGRNQTIMATLNLRTLGEVKSSTPLGFVAVNDGVKAQP